MTNPVELLASTPTDLFIDGAWRPSTSGARLDVEDPATATTIASVADATPHDGQAALDAAVAAQHDWAATPARRRADVLRTAFDLVRERTEEFALLITTEMGKPLAEARGEVAYGNEFLRWFSEEAPRIHGRYGPTPEGTGTMTVSHHPVGPCLLITPWNFPLAMATRKIAPALAAGCTAVIKPAALTPLTTLALAQVLHEAGLPPGVLNVVTTSRSSALSTPLLADPRLRKVSFTGSTPVGQTLLEHAAQGVLRTSMELGGNAPFLVFDDADLDAAVEGALAAKFRNMGQACTAANRFLVHRSLADEFTARITDRVAALVTGPGTRPGVTIGPLIDARAVTKTHALVTDAVTRGAKVTTGGDALDGPGHFYAPTVLTDVTPGSRVLHEEIFGPVLAVTAFETDDEAVALANNTEYGLASYAYTRSLTRAQALTARLHAGMMGINTGVISNAAAPFGGWKMSGLGREGGPEGIGEYLQTKYTLMPDPTGSSTAR